MPDAKRRNGWLTAYLVLMAIANAGTALLYLLGGDSVRASFPGLPGWALPVLAGLTLVNLACVIAVFKWKKWGFWGLCATTVLAFPINLSIGVGLGKAVIGLLGVAILYGALQLGTDNKGWPQLE